MQVTETLNEGLKRGYKIVVPASELASKVDAKIEDARANFAMKGFRRGKAPAALMKKMFGKSVLGEAMQETIDGAIRDHFEGTGDQPAAQPDVKMTNEDWKEGDDVEVDLSYERLPDVPEVEFSKISLTRLAVPVEDKDVDDALSNLAENANHFEPRETGSEAEDGDQVVIDFKGSIDGEAFDGGSAEDFPLVLGSGNFIPGFEEQLQGIKAGEDKDVPVTFPDTYPAENLAGKEAVFAVSVKEVKEPKAAPIDDELAKKFGEESLDKLKAALSERVGKEYGDAARMVMKRELLDDLSDRVTFDLPPSMVDAEADQIAHQLWHDENPDVEGHDHPKIEPTDEHRKLAERRVRLGLLLAEIGKRSEIKLTEEEIRRAIMEQAQQYGPQGQQFLEFVQKNPQMQQQITAPLFEDKVVDYIFELAAVTEKKSSKDDLEKAVKALEED